MKQKLIMILVCAALVVPATAMEPVWENALKQMPADAVGFVSVPSISQLDSDIQKGLTSIGMIMFVPPPFNMGPISAFLQTELMMDEELLDKDGAFTIVVMPMEGDKPDVTKLEKSVAIMLPSKDPAKMLEAMGAVKGEGGVWSLNLAGDPSFAAAAEKCIIVGPNAEAVNKIASAPKGLKVSDNDMNVLNQTDLAIWVDWSKAIYPFRDQINGFLDSPMFQMMTGGMTGLGGMDSDVEYEMNDEGELVPVEKDGDDDADEEFDIEAEYARISQKNTKDQINMLLDGVDKGVFGISLTADELVFRVGLTATKGSEMGKLIEASPTTTKSLLTGLPGGNWIIAGGQLSSKLNNEQAMKQFMPMIDLLGKFKGVDKEAFTKARNALETMATMGKAGTFYLGTNTPGPDGVVTMAVVGESTDAQKNLELMQVLFDNIKKALPADILEDEEIKAVVDALVYTPEAETIADVPVGHLKFDLKGLAEKNDDIDIDELEEVFKVIGQDGVLFRSAAPTKDKIVITFGGKEFTKSVIEQVKKGGAPLEDDPTVKAASKVLPKEKNSIILFSIDNLVKGITNGIKSIDEEEQLPIVIMPIEMPISLAGTGKGNWGGGECHIPLKAIQSVTGGVMQMMMGAAMGGPAPGGPAPAPGPQPVPVEPAPEKTAPQPQEKIAA